MEESERLAELEQAVRAAYADNRPEGQRDLAELEFRLWSLASSEMKRGKLPKQRREKYFVALGQPGTQAECRGALYNMGDAAEPLWAIVHEGRLSSRQAYEASSRAKRAHRRGRGPLSRFVELVLAEKLAVAKHEPTTYKKRDRAPDHEPTAGEEEFSQAVHALALDHARKALSDLEQWESEQLAWQLAAEVQSAATSFMARVRAKRRGSVSVGRAELRKACELLGIPVPTKRRAFDYVQARRHHKKLLAAHHPDRNKNRNAVAMYRAANEAMATLERWRIEQGLA